MSGWRVIERVARNAPLGLRFRDLATGSDAVGGLWVEVFPRANPRARVRALPNRSGVYAAHALPAAAAAGSPPEATERAWELADVEPAALWAGAPRPYRIEVRDPRGRFLPMAFDADLPARGLLAGVAPWLSPPGAAAGGIPLFSAPARPVPEPLAVVRAHLRDAGTRREAAWCLLGVSVNGAPRGLGMADERGRVAVLFPYPEPPGRSLASPPEPRDGLTWPLELTAYPAAAAATEIPDLAEVLDALGAPRAVIEPAGGAAAPARLAYRQELTVRTAGASGEDASYLAVAA